MKKSVYQTGKIVSSFLLPSALSLLFFFSFSIFSSCITYKLEKALDPESKEFLSKARYIISKQERKIFLNLPPSEREAFIEEFWKKRDPDPYTEENEFKEQYLARIEMANRLFKGGGSPGWLQDRGRIYILFGPPDRRDQYPRGYTFYGKPMEIWYYGFFPIVFIDNYWNGNYKLEPLSAQHISEINKTQMEIKPKVEAKAVVFDFDLKIRKIKENKVLVQIRIPYKNIWFAGNDNKLKTILELSMEIFDSSQKKVWKHKKNYPLSLTEENLSEIIGKYYLIEIPINLESGVYSLTSELENKTDESRVRKNVKFII